MNSKLSESIFKAALWVGAIAVGAGAQTFTKADSGWVRLFNGVDFTGFYSRLYAAPVVHPVDTSAFGIIYPGTDSACLRVKTTTKRGEVGTDKTTYSHYRTRLEYKFDGATTSFNAGLLYGVDETVNRMQNNWPRGFEFQMQQSEPGAVYSIQQVTANTRASGSTYSPTGTNVTICEIGCTRRSYLPSPILPASANGASRWMRIELVQRGSDTAWHIVNDTLVLKIWNIRIFNDSTRPTGSTASGSNSASNFTPNGPYNHGALAVEGEGALINHRRWEVMEFPASTPMNENFLHRLVLTNRQAIKPAGSSPVTLTWGSIGTIPKVRLQYRIGATGALQTITDSTPNTGSYAWTAPASVPDSIRFRISSYDYVPVDSTGAVFTTGVRSAQSLPSIRFSLDARGLTVTDMGLFQQVEVWSASGKLLRSLPVRGADFHWDLTGAAGARVPTGVYFLKLKGVGFARSLRVPVF